MCPYYLYYLVGQHVSVAYRTIIRSLRAKIQWRIQQFFSGGGVQQIQLRTEDREDGDLGAVAP